MAEENSLIYAPSERVSRRRLHYLVGYCSPDGHEIMARIPSVLFNNVVFETKPAQQLTCQNISKHNSIY